MDLPDTNLALLVGRITADPIVAELPSGAVVYSWSVNVASGDGPATSVPVVAFDPIAAVRRRGRGDTVVVEGSVRRRFFRSAGTTQSRTEVVVSRLVSARAEKAVAALFDSAKQHLEGLAGSV